MRGILASKPLDPARGADEEGFHEGQAGAHHTGGGLGGGEDDVEVVGVCFVEVVVAVYEEDCCADYGDEGCTMQS